MAGVQPGPNEGRRGDRTADGTLLLLPALEDVLARGEGGTQLRAPPPDGHQGVLRDVEAVASSKEPVPETGRGKTRQGPGAGE
eukprot:8672360-Lingulodinium_polyedra.AAC.1